MKNENRTPLQIAVFFLSLLFVFGFGSYLNTFFNFPITKSFSVELPEWKIYEKDPLKKVNIETDPIQVIDTLINNQPKLEKIEIVYPNLPTGLSQISFSPNDSVGFSGFYKSLNNLDEKDAIRILHFGDSQIEGDRMTREIRDFFQNKYGGEGAGIQNLTPFVPMAAVDHRTQGEWRRMVSFGRKNQKQEQGRYGLTGVAHSYEQQNNDYPDAIISFRPRKYGYEKARRFSSFELSHGPSKGPLEVKWFANDTLWRIQYIDSSASEGNLVLVAPESVAQLRLEFRGKSPDWYGISLDGKSGVNVDNISMRGASGLSFTQMDQIHFGRQLRHKNIGLVILQFGGNSVPYFKSKEAVARYGKSFIRQIKLFQELLPTADILVIGPSDMAVKDGLNWVSYPFVSEVRDVMRQAAFSENVGFFDLFDLMGSEGSMVDWVNQSPPLAGPDHIHFTPRGSKKVGKAIVASLEFELGRYE